MARFVLATLLISVLLAVPLMAYVYMAPPGFVPTVVRLLIPLVPVWSMIIASIGSPSGRKIRFVLGSLVFMLVFALVAFATGWQAFVEQTAATGATSHTFLVGLYRLVIVGTGAVTLVLFVGKAPSVFWTAGPGT